MTTLREVFYSLESASQLQLLLAFVACIGYALGQGRLLPNRARVVALVVAAIAAVGFAAESDYWPAAAMLVAIAVVALGGFTAAAWLLSRMLRVEPPALPIEAEQAAPDAPLPSAALEANPVHHGDASPLVRT